MAQLDIKKCTFRIVDGRRATLSIGASNAGVTYTLVSRHHGTKQDVLVAHVTAGISTPLSVAVTTSPTTGKTTITVNLATNGSSIAISTASQVRTAVNAAVTAAALVTASLVGDGSGTAVAAAAAAVNTAPARFISFKVGDGTLSWTEAKDNKYTLDRGTIDTVLQGDEQEMSVSTGYTWEEFTASTGSGTPAPFDALNQEGEASGWTSTSDDPDGCSPYCVDLEVTYDPGNCGSQIKEIYTYEEFYWDDVNPTWKDGKVSFSGKCNRVAPTLTRVA